MIEHEFKPGDRVFSIPEGVITLREAVWDSQLYPIQGRHYSYTAAGKMRHCDTHPSLYTLTQARKMGFSVPDEPLRVKCEVRWASSLCNCGCVIPVPGDITQVDFRSLLGKIGILVFTQGGEG